MLRIKYTRPKLYKKQLEAFYCRHRYSLIEATTKAGKTVGGIAWLFEQAINGKDGNNYWWVAPVYGQAAIAYNRMKRGIKAYSKTADKKKDPKEIFKFSDGNLTITLPNGSKIWFKSGEKPDNLYGEDVYAVVIDEASRIREEAWFAIRSTITSTKGPVRAIGNVKGTINWFYKMSRKAEGGHPEMSYHKITAIDAVAAGILDQEEIDDARDILPIDVFNELYLAIPTEDGTNPFGMKYIDGIVSELSEEEPKYYGIDLARITDFTVIIALDKYGQLCYMDRFQKSWGETKKEIIRRVGRKFALIDSTGVGDPIVEDVAKRCRRTDGFKFTNPSKQGIIEGLAVAIQNNEITIIEGFLVNELKSFEYIMKERTVSYGAPSGMHDDGVCALALAVECFRRNSRRGLRAQTIR